MAIILIFLAVFPFFLGYKNNPKTEPEPTPTPKKIIKVMYELNSSAPPFESGAYNKLRYR